ncbi:uncharacterized protein LOC132733957 isoform X2 [Ruditapes philippinarum]|uniref:uncharacterized protein LOC132733957 isoform X2 n=1 Tax=Ruditapes philippinarum TaxID=129788 RepID=UPI00295B3C73|nr:uncharacterized protein LOC132733957 isoform X2 [Ruditapes philippinarum]
MIRYKMDFRVFLSVIILVSIFILGKNNVESALIVTSADVNATGIENGLSATFAFTGPTNVTCMIIAENEDEVEALEILQSDPQAVETSFILNGFYDLYIPVFGDTDLYIEKKENFYVGSSITGIDISNNVTGSVIPFNAPLDDDIDFTFSFSTGTDVNATISLPDGWSHSLTNINNESHTVTIPKDRFMESGLYTVDVDLVNPLAENGILRSAVLAVQAPVDGVTISLTPYEVGNEPVYIMVGQEFNVLITLTTGDDLMHSLLVEQNTTIVDLKGNFCEGQQLQNEIPYTFESAGSYNITVEISNYVSYFSKTIEINVIYAVDLTLEVTPLLFSSETASFTATVTDTANLPMGTVSCKVDYNDDSPPGYMIFDMSPSTFGELASTTNTLTKTYTERWYNTIINCTNQLPSEVNSLQTYAVLQNIVKVVNEITTTFQLSHDIDDIGHHPFTKPITFSIHQTSVSDPTYANVTCEFNSNDGTTDELTNVTGEVTTASNITLIKTFDGGKNHTISVKCSNLKSFQVFPPITVHVYFNCWTTEEYFDASFKKPNGAFRSKTNEEFTLKPNVRLSGFCHGDLKHYWTLYRRSNTGEQFIKNLTSESATIINLPKFTVEDEATYKLELSTYFVDYVIIPILRDFADIDFSLPPLTVIMKVNNSVNSIETMRLDHVFLDSIDSSDPSEKDDFDTNILTRSWACRTGTALTKTHVAQFIGSTDLSIWPAQADVDCTSYLQPSAVNFLVDKSNFKFNQYYIISLKVERNTRSSTRAQALYFVEDDPLNITLNCLSCPDKTDGSADVSSIQILPLTDLEINCVVLTPGTQNNTFDYKWTFQQTDDEHPKLSEQGSSTGFKLTTDYLKSLREKQPSAQYIVTVTVKADGFADTSSNFIFAINQPPYDGNCVFETPLNGPVTASIDIITVTCTGWKDEYRNPRRDPSQDSNSNVQYAATQVYLTETGEVNETLAPNVYESTYNTKFEFRLLKPPGGINMTRVEIRVVDHLKTPFTTKDLGDIQISPAVQDDASGEEGVAQIDTVLNSTGADLQNALKTKSLSGAATVITSITSCLPDNPLEYEVISVANDPDAGGVFTKNEDGEPISPDDLAASYSKPKEDPTVLKAQVVMVEMTGALLNSTKSQSPETQKDPEVQKEVVKTMSSFAGAAKHLTKESKEIIADVAANLFSNTKEVKSNDPVGEQFITDCLDMAAKVASAMAPKELKGVKMETDLEAERERTEYESQFMSEQTKKDFENGKLSQDEVVFYKALDAKRKASEVNAMRDLCNNYSKSKSDYEENMVQNMQLSDGSVKSITTASAQLVVTTDTVEKLKDKTLNTTGATIKINGLEKLNKLQKAKIGLVEQNSVSHIDKKGMAGAVASGEKTLMIETLGEIPGTVQVTQKVPEVNLETVPVVVDADDASQFMYFQVYVKNTFVNLNFNIEPDVDSPVKILKFVIYILYCDVKDLESKYVSKVEYTSKKEISEANGWVAQFTASERLEKKGIYKIGVETIKDESSETDRLTKRSVLNQNETIKFGTATMACMTWDDIRDEWRSDECTGTWKPKTGELDCDCKPKKKMTFANSFYVAPNKIDFSSVFLKFSPLNQAAVMAVLILIFIIYILIIIWTRRQDRKDLLKWGITPLSDNFMEDNYFYVIKVFTGMRPGAGTKSRICMVICGEEMDTGVRELYDGVREEFSTGSVMNFLMSTTVYLGDLDYIRIWHDNSGGGSYASWYLSRIDVHDVQRNESFSFLGERWLAVEKEDGLLECILPICKTENLNIFKNRFFMNAKDNLADSHIWISVAYRPQVSNFTRTQRASCALLFVMLTMIANAMFFRGSNEDNYETPAELQVGPFRFSLQQIYISFVCALIVTPGTLIVIYLFKLSKRIIDPNETLFKANDKASRYKIPFMKNWLENEQKRSMELEQHLVQKGLPNMQGFSLPHWCRYVAWFIVIVTSFICAFFIMSFSMQWGKQKSEEWITTFLLSFFESVFCLDPVKVGIMAVVLAILFRSTKDSEAPVNRSTIMKRYSSSLRGKSKSLRLPAPPLDQKKLEKARDEKNRDMLMKRALRDIIVNIIIIWILFSISFSNRDTMSYYMHKRVVDSFLTPPNMPAFESIRTTTDFFDWMQNTAIINGFPEFENDAKNTPLHWRVRQFTEGGTHFRVGPPRLRQLRTTKKSCTNSPFPTVNCYKKYYETNEETENYCIGWKDGTCHPDEKIYNFTSDAWKFTSAFDIWGMPISGYYTTYGGGGYIAKLSVNRKVSVSIMDELYRNSWVDRQTRAVLFEFTLYCLNANIFTYNMFMVEFPETGGAIPFYMILPMRVFLHQGPLGLYTLACEVLFVLYLIFLTVTMIIQMYQQKKDFFKQGWQIYDMIFIILGYVAIAMNIVQVVFTNMSLDVFREDKKAFVNFYHLALWNTFLVLLIGILVFMATVRMLNILGYNKRIGAVAKVFTKAASDLLWFGLFFSFVFVCYAAFGFLLFGWKLKSYKNVFKTMGTLFISMIGKSRFTEIEETDPVFSKVYFMCFIFFVVYMILTMFLAVLSKAIDQVHEDTKKDKSEEMVDYCIKKLKGLLSYGSGTKKATVKPAPWSRGNRKEYQGGKFNKATNREILQEIRETMNEALTDFTTPDSEHSKRQVKFRR